MIASKFLWGEIARLHQRYRQGMTHRHRHNHTGSGSEVVRIGFALDGGIDQNIHLGSQRRGWVADDSDQRRAEIAKDGDEADQFGRNAAVGDEYRGIAGGVDAEVAMEGVGGVQEDGRCARAAQSGYQLPGYMAGFSDSG